MIPEAAVWAIIGIPFACFLIIVALIRPFMNDFPRVSGYTTIGGLLVAFILSVWALWSVMDSSAHSLHFASYEWFTIGDFGSGAGFQMTVGLLLDPLTAIMLIVITGVSLMVQVYSQGYMSGDSSYSRYFAFMSFFTASMLGLVLSRNLIQLFFFWELVGLSSYLLIGFWHSRPSAVAAAKKAFIVTRIGDLGFLLALLYLFANRGPFLDRGLNPFEIPDILFMAPLLAGGVCTWLALGLFAGAMGKSAQFPLHTWLPDAMEGPTPVSSLIHAATMVAAGVFLVARMFPLFDSSVIGTPVVQNTVAIVGGGTALFAALMAIVANDIKRVLAYSTISQLGYMMLALGLGAPEVAIFHLFNHAFFKCLLFLGAGSVHHSVHTFDMRYMGGLRRVMPLTYGAMVIGGLSLAGIFPLAGFWSKDEILNVAWYGTSAGSLGLSRVLFIIGCTGAFLTAFYIFRLISMTFHGEFRGGIDAVPREKRIPEEIDAHVHLHESPLVMTAPMVVLSVAALISGYFSNATIGFAGIPSHWFAHMLGQDAPHFSWPIAVVSSVVAICGILLATRLHQLKIKGPASISAGLKICHTVLARRFYMDELYEGVVVRRVLYQGVFKFSDWIDRRLIDGFVDLVSWISRNSGRALAQVQTGQAQTYGTGIVVGIVVILSVYISQL
jgi:NADH-quinone oxidoreductase subunit L